MLIPNDMFHHANMLADQIRLLAFYRALERQLVSDQVVVDIGTGTGILASYAATMTKNTVYGIEYFENSAKVAAYLASNSDLDNLVIVNAKSYGRPIDAKPEVVITETIGALGPEENIVELCYEFQKRYPSVKNFIPAKLTVWAVPVYSRLLEEKRRATMAAFKNASHASFNFDLIGDSLNQSFCAQLLGHNLSDATITGAKQKLVEYQLGAASSSDFKCAINLAGAQPTNAIHFYFEADLGGGISLQSDLGSPLTHWQHRAVFRPECSDVLAVSYSSATNQFNFNWSVGRE